MTRAHPSRAHRISLLPTFFSLLHDDDLRLPDMMRDSKLMPPTTSTTAAPRSPTPTARSWRRTVADALALAQSAVELDSNNTDPMGALAAYTESVRRLRGILARLKRHGAYAEASQLAAICEGYSDRMRLLCVACEIPPPPYEYYASSESNDYHHDPSSALSSPPPAYDESGREPR